MNKHVENVMGSTLSPHAVHRLYQYRKSLSTKEFGARGKNLKRCELCLLGQQYCTCEFRSLLKTNAAFLLLMYDDEVLKPTNSGRLIADLVPDTWAYLWSRTEVNQDVLSLLADPQFMPFIVFPGEYATSSQMVCNEVTPDMLQGKRPLFVMLDGRWREAVKMFRKSPYLESFPLLSFDAGALARYALRKGSRDFQFGTAEVASMVLSAMGEADNAASLATWFDLFVESSLLGRNRRPNTSLAERERLISQFQSQVQDGNR